MTGNRISSIYEIEADLFLNNQKQNKHDRHFKNNN